MKKYAHLLIISVSILLFALLTYVFVFAYEVLGLTGSDFVQGTLYATLKSIDLGYLINVLVLVAFYMALLDLLVLFIKRSWQKTRGQATSLLHGNRTIHLTFLLLTIFVTLSTTAPSSVMNSFTAIVSISVLLSNLAKKIGK